MNKNAVYILGDICPRWSNTTQFSTHNPKCVFNELCELFDSAGLVIANLEAPATNNEIKLNKNSINLKMLPDDLTLLKSAGIDGLSLANNHILDYGVKGLEDTIEGCQNTNLFYFGAGSVEEASRPHFIELNNFKIGLLSFAEQEFNCAVDYGKGANLWDDLESIKIIREAKDNCDYLIILYHGGIEEYIYPSPALQKKCHFMCEAGADLVTCQHSHCIGTRENYKNSEILYGQGNCVFGYEENNPQWNNGLIIKIDFSNKPTISYIPITADTDGEHLLESTLSAELLASFYKKSETLSDSAFLKSKWVDFCHLHKDSYLPMLFSWNKITNKLNRLTNGRLINFFTSKKSRMNSMNLIRCDAHKELIKTVLENDFFMKK